MNSHAPALRRTVAIAALAVFSFGTLVAGSSAHARPEMGHGMAGGLGLPLHPGHLERLLDGAGVSADQKGQIKTILQTLRNDMQAQRQGGKALHEQAAQVFAAPNVDARAAEALRQQMLARHDASSKRMMQAMLDVSRVLTAEQRAKLFEQMKQRRSLMERHRAEREQLDGAPRR
jgi:periplasmic protein CpxP/Spy